MKKYIKHIGFAFLLLLLLVSVLFQHPTPREMAAVIAITSLFSLAYIAIKTM